MKSLYVMEKRENITEFRDTSHWKRFKFNFFFFFLKEISINLFEETSYRIKINFKHSWALCALWLQFFISLYQTEKRVKWHENKCAGRVDCGNVNYIERHNTITENKKDFFFSEIVLIAITQNFKHLLMSANNN